MKLSASIWRGVVFVVAMMAMGHVAWAESNWKQMISNTSSELRAIWGTSENNLFVVGHNGTILHYDGSQWANMESGTSKQLFNIWGTSGDNIFVVGGNGSNDGVVLHYDGNNWTEITDSVTNELLSGVWGNSENNIFAINNGNGYFLHYNGNNWSELPRAPFGSTMEIWGASENNVFVINGHGDIANYRDNQWNTVFTESSNRLSDILGISDDNIFVVGWEGTIIHYDDSGWNTMDSGTTNHLYGVWGNSENNVFAVGWNGMILHYDGEEWNPMDSNTSQRLHAVWGTETDVFSVGRQGTILRYCDCSPTASFTASQMSGNAPLEVSLDASASFDDSDGTIVSYTWAASNEDTANGVTTTMTFTEKGSYLIVLTVTDNDGNTATAERTINVGVPNLVGLANFIATTKDGGIHLEWETASEIDNAGFYIVRARKDENGKYTEVIRITEQLIQSVNGSINGASYSYVDSNVISGNTYYYALEDIEFSGKRTIHLEFIDSATAK